MKKMLFLMCLTIIGAALFGVSGHISQDTTWNTDQIITGVLYVDSGATLTIAAGVKILFPKVDQNADSIGDIYIEVSGKLQVQGTVNSRVVFSSNEILPAKGDWSGIRFITPQGGASSSMSYTDVLYANESVNLNGRGITLNNARIANSSSYGMRIVNSHLTTSINNSLIEENNGYGIQIESGPVTINGLELSHNDSFGIKIFNAASVTATNLVSSSNSDTGIWILNDQDASFTNSRSLNNGKYGVLLDGASATFTNCIVTLNKDMGVVVDKLTANPSFNNCSFKMNMYAGIVFRNSQGIVNNSEILNNLGNGIIAVNSQPTVQNCNISGNQGGQLEDVTVPNWTINSDLPLSNDPHALIANVTYRRYALTVYGSNITCLYSSRMMYLGNEYLSNSATVNYDGYTSRIFESVMAGELYALVMSPNELRFTGESTNQSYPITGNVTNYTRYNYQGGVTQATIINTIGLVANMNNNYWGQVNGLETLISYRNPGTVDYGTISASAINGAGCTLSNLAPTITILAPTSMIINPSSYEIPWSDKDLDDNANISLYYTENPSQNGTLIVDNISEDSATNSYTWNCSSVPPGSYHIIAVISDGVNPAVTSVSAGRIMVGALQVYMPNNALGAAGTTLEIPVKTVNTVDYHGIVSFQFTLTYNSNVINATGITTVGTLTANSWSVFANTLTPGQISVSGFSVAPLNSSGDLVKIVFNVQPGLADFVTSPLNFSTCVLNAGTPVATLVNGLFQVSNQYGISGSVKYFAAPNLPIPNVNLAFVSELITYNGTTNTNGEYSFTDCLAQNYILTPSCSTAIQNLIISPYDAALTAQSALSLISFTNLQKKAADVNGDGFATVYDAALIAQYSVGLISSFPAGTWGFNPISQSFNMVNNFQNVLYWGYVVGDPSGNWAPTVREDTQETSVSITARNGMTVSIPIEWNEPFVSGYLQMRYDPAQLRYLRTAYDSALEDYQCMANAENGTLRVSAFGVHPVTSNEPIFNVQFEVLNSASAASVFVEAVQFDEVSADLYPTGIYDDVIQGLALKLNQNYPNPFNPVTNISYSLPNKSNVKLSVFNLKGQLVKELVNESKSAGNYTISYDAKEIASGVYFYRLETDQGSIIRKMLLMK